MSKLDKLVAETLQQNKTNPVADRLIRQYQMVVVCPGDPGARGIFSAMLDDWRMGRSLKLVDGPATGVPNHD